MFAIFQTMSCYYFCVKGWSDITLSNCLLCGRDTGLVKTACVCGKGALLLMFGLLDLVILLFFRSNGVFQFELLGFICIY